jgi:hypothetical protein
MDLKSLRPASDFAAMYGCKALIYGPPGSGKTPLINTAPRPLMLACEPGLLSMRGSKVPTYPAFTGDAIDDFFKWFFGSTETKNFDTIAVDSVSQLCEIYLTDLMTGKSKSGQKIHGMVAYGTMATKVKEHLSGLYFTQNKHTYLIAKQESYEDNGMRIKRPWFPGKQLPIDIPHMYDAVLQLDTQNVPGHGQQKAFRCIGSIDVVARNRTGTLAEFEYPDFSAIVKKVMM